ISSLIALARQQGLDLVEADARLDQTGLDFVALHALDVSGQPWIVRTPRRPAVVAAARVEARVLGFVRARLPVAVPDWEVHTASLIASRRLAGTPVVTIGADGPTWNVVDPAAPGAAFLDSLAAVLAALAAIDPADALAAGVPLQGVDDARADFARALR